MPASIFLIFYSSISTEDDDETSLYGLFLTLFSHVWRTKLCLGLGEFIGEDDESSFTGVTDLLIDWLTS